MGPIDSLIEKYSPRTASEYENALKQVIQEITLAGLARANFFDVASFCGGTALRIFHGLPRFSEDLDFTLMSNHSNFALKNYFGSVVGILKSFGFDVEVVEVKKKTLSKIESAFVKANTKIHLLKIDPGKKLAAKVQNNKLLSVKFEVDTTPCLGFETEVKILPPPITSSIRVLKLPYLFGGKMHAILFRRWRNRVKGRDFYDLLWFLGQNVPLSLSYLESKMRDGGVLKKNKSLTRETFLEILEERIRTIDFETAAQDVAAFIKDPLEVSSWSSEMFLAGVRGIKIE